ncbi:hypothetical protein FRD01_23155 [Microvenator marinus]|uniref:Lipoprotein n=1 Tax=Microvenator marinus TaxID=2600177 RepID=A0A5B8XWZ0_9DELT|nr:hypothetical protein [Microvenator marinus]QED30080.1 hypothetical protein FRD01_23155 [Microvenator marinus]
MKKQSILFLLVGALGCSNNGDSPSPQNRELKLPSSSIDHSICEDEDKRYLSGGDVDEVVQRIVVGEVSSISFLEVDDRTGCAETSYSWTLRVGVQISQALKGESGEIFVNVRPEYLTWASLPIRREGAVWLPEWPNSPAIEVSDELGWSGDTGLQVGQEVVLFLMETNGVLHTGKMPWGNHSAGQVTFPINEVGGCKYLPESWHDGVTLEELEADLQGDLVADNDFVRQELLEAGPTLKSFCSKPPVSEPTNDMGTD